MKDSEKTISKAAATKLGKQLEKTIQQTSEKTGSKTSKLLTRLAVSAILVLVLLAQWLIREAQPGAPAAVTPQDVPEYNGSAYAILNDNMPLFTEDEKVTADYEFYSELDALGRCGYTMACLGKALMPTIERGSISHVKPSGWVQAQYDIVDGGSLYNRCHLIGWQLSGEDANQRNLITGTRYMNVEGMLPFENMVADYIKETGNHVMYRVTPIFSGNELVARGVQIEALSVEDGGEGICFHVYVYNVQPGVEIRYQTGESWAVS